MILFTRNCYGRFMQPYPGFLATISISLERRREPGITLPRLAYFMNKIILGDPGADSGGEGKSKRAEKYGTKKRKGRREEPLGTMSYQTGSKRSPPFCLLIGQKNTKVFWHQSEGRTAATVWNWSGRTLFPGALLAVLYFSSCHIFPLRELLLMHRCQL